MGILVYKLIFKNTPPLQIMRTAAYLALVATVSAGTNTCKTDKTSTDCTYAICKDLGKKITATDYVMCSDHTAAKSCENDKDSVACGYTVCKGQKATTAKWVKCADYTAEISCKTEKSSEKCSFG